VNKFRNEEQNEEGFVVLLHCLIEEEVKKDWELVLCFVRLKNWNCDWELWTIEEVKKYRENLGCVLR